jgi:hypothetical protein
VPAPRPRDPSLPVGGWSRAPLKRRQGERMVGGDWGF